MVTPTINLQLFSAGLPLILLDLEDRGGPWNQKLIGEEVLVNERGVAGKERSRTCLSSLESLKV